MRNMVASYKRDMQRLNQKVETFLQQYFQKQQPEPQEKIPASSCSPPTWLHILPAELLDDITTLVPSFNHSNINIHPQHPPQPQLGGWRALYHDRALAKLLEAISRFIVYGYYGTASWCSWTANPCSSSLPSSSTSTSSCWQLVDKNGLSEKVTGGETQEEQKYIDAPAMMQALCFSSKEANSPCWKKLLQTDKNAYNSDDCGAFSFKPTVERISCGPDQEGRSGLILQIMEENLLFVTFVEVGWKSEWDLFLVGVSPLSGRLVGLHTC